MSLTQEQIEKLSAILSKIKLEDSKLGKDINNILKYVDLLNEIDTLGVKCTTSVVEKENILREDKIAIMEALPKDLLKCSKQKVIADQIAISNIMK